MRATAPGAAHERAPEGDDGKRGHASALPHAVLRQALRARRHRAAASTDRAPARERPGGADHALPRAVAAQRARDEAGLPERACDRERDPGLDSVATAFLGRAAAGWGVPAAP